MRGSVAASACAITGLSEAAKSRTPLLAGETPAAALTSNFRIDQHGLVESVGALAERVHRPASAADDAQRTYQRAACERGPVTGSPARKARTSRR
jgi:hypothetical protein